MRPGPLVLIGGREDKTRDREILREVARRARGGKLCIATLASTIGSELWKEYRRIFRQLGLSELSHLEVVDRTGAQDRVCLRAVDGASAIFFTGGDQLRITAELGGTELADRLETLHQRGGMIAGTSAGAAVMSELMLIAQAEDRLAKTGLRATTAPGLGYLRNVILDQHFAERARIGRLIGAIAQNPQFLGIGINEDTAILVENRELRVIGSGSVYVLDAHESNRSNASEGHRHALSFFNTRLHILGPGDRFDLRRRLPRTAAETTSPRPGLRRRPSRGRAASRARG